MRLDKYLKVSRIIKRRTVAKEACENGRVKINGKVAKPSSEIKEGDIIEIKYANSILKARILNVKQHALKQDAQSMYEIISDVNNK
ncbi:RNA-binding S4 domain-containing protein [Clostridium sp.]|jgi:ribosomal 50S subunit-recycling heat shock protein|uniref:RNA-binding S4 domain-containing protein n=1 Tax=Clostridium sp. TaxID=1506 RepID=UPI003A5C67BC